MGFLWNFYKKFAGMAKKPPLKGEPRGAARPVAFPYEGKVARRKP